MALTKAQRADLRAMFGGRCGYCGQPLGDSFHADHVEAVRRGCGNDGGMLRPDRDTVSNMLPACIPCNLFKGIHSIEQFRKEIAAQVERARNYSVNYRTAERFGLVSPTGATVVFYFEAVAAGLSPSVPDIPPTVKKKGWRSQLPKNHDGGAGRMLAAISLLDGGGQ